MTDRIIFISSLLGFILLFAITTFVYLLLKGQRNWKLKVKNSPVDRMSQTQQSFVDYYINKGYTSKSAEFVYQKTQLFLRAKDIVLLPEDDLIKLYERQAEEWFYITNKWCAEIGKPQPDEKRLNSLLTKHKAINFEFLIELFDK
jgi:hypothetical protein